MIEGRTAVVTGGGRGIGAAVARALAEAGVAVIVAARTEADVEAVAAGIRSDGGAAWGIACDVTDEAGVARLHEEAVARLGDVDILVNSAGIAGSAPLHRTSLEAWNRYFAVNATGCFLTIRAFLPPMMERGRGRIVNVASVAGLHGARYISAYSASKHAVIGLTRSVAAEAAPSGVTVNAVCPGYVDTGMTDESIARIVEKTGRSEEEALEIILGGMPQKRLIEPGEVAHAVLSLCAADAKGINGQSIVIDGGGLLA